MAEIHITAITITGPVVRTKHRAILRDKTWPGGGTIKELVLFIGSDVVTITPACPDDIAELGNNLLKLAKELKSNVKEAKDVKSKGTR
jgi:hypothetical protein